MDTNLINIFSNEATCLYKDEHYLARDNGAILRSPRSGKRSRPNDNQWTFGKVNYNTGVMEIASVPVHRIVATAFHGVAPSKGHVVDHIDTNKQNNRPENLRWVTRLENILLNPITARRIALACGSVEAFLANPSLFRESFFEPNFEWMRAVSADEAKISYERLLAWAKDDKHPVGGTLDEWIFDRGIVRAEPVEVVPELTISLTPNAVQRDWRTVSEFPCCPQHYDGDPIQAYASSLIAGSVFCKNDLYVSVVLKSAVSNDLQSIYIITKTEDGIKRWALAQVTFENDFFVHASLGSFFEENGAEKYYCLAQGLEWTGGDGIDDYC